ncbi:MAG: cyclic nucleotide-binding domain-containing protein [Pseudomonas marincola]
MVNLTKTLKDDEDRATSGECASQRFFAGNSAQPKTNYCSQCGAHKTALCSKLSGDDLQEFGEKSTHKNFQPGQMLFNDGDEAACFFTVVSGEVRLSRMLDDGRRQITGFKSVGDFVGLTTNGLYSADAEAIDDVVVCQFTVPVFEKTIENFAAVQSRLMEMMQKEIIDMQNHMLLLGRKTPVEKIANFLVERVQKNTVQSEVSENNNTAEVLLPMSRTDIADFLGLTIETVSRTITKLRKLDVIELKSFQHIVILDFAELQFLADGDN